MCRGSVALSLLALSWKCLNCLKNRLLQGERRKTNKSCCKKRIRNGRNPNRKIINCLHLVTNPVTIMSLWPVFNQATCNSNSIWLTSYKHSSNLSAVQNRKTHYRERKNSVRSGPPPPWKPWHQKLLWLGRLCQNNRRCWWLRVAIMCGDRGPMSWHRSRL